MRRLLLLLLWMPLTALAMGNYPSSTTCTADKPYQAICTHSLHSLEGWHGHCYATAAEAQAEADRHAKAEHAGNSRWTGIQKAYIEKQTQR